MKDYEDEAFDELEKSLQRKAVIEDKKDAALRLALDALGAYLSATDEDEDAHAHSLMADAFFKLKEALEDK